MNPIEQAVRGFQDFVTQVPEVIQPVILMIAGAVPYIEGEGAAPIGVVGGIDSFVAGLSAAAGNFLAVSIVLWITVTTTILWFTVDTFILG
ncbi:MAG TPA: hypothetical protein H9830_15280 [Candidatus Agrococcus pullicola]|uniref:Uncharacterized protein n=1 Tax=Candidatus Agrococcus pullicola TaxID=2838429 RepID=A0A9D1YYH0_9MICO|nr:hypothetical protein [Candidatus Agrococcus pullicola]